jgi:hypothetical protein
VLVAAAVLPHPPLLVPPLASGAVTELDLLRHRCAAGVTRLWSASPDVTYVVGKDGGHRASSFRPWGVEVAVDVPEPLPLPLLVGAWLTMGRLRSFVAVDDDLDPPACAELGAELAGSAAHVALLVMGDGSARHSEKAPGYLDSRSAIYDEAVHRALADADLDGLLGLDDDLARALMVAGRAPWQVLAGAARGVPAPVVVEAAFEAPYGVGYHTALWAWQEPA